MFYADDLRQRFINYCVNASIPGLDGRDAGLLYDHIAKEPGSFLTLVTEMRTLKFLDAGDGNAHPLTQWDVQTTGSNSNGGGFDPGVVAPGTDASEGSRTNGQRTRHRLIRSTLAGLPDRPPGVNRAAHLRRHAEHYHAPRVPRYCTVSVFGFFCSRGFDRMANKSSLLESFFSMAKRVRATGESPNSEQKPRTCLQAALLILIAG